MSQKKKAQIDQAATVLQPCFPLKETIFAAVLLLGAGLLAYSDSFTGKFIFDDNDFIKDLQAYPLREYLLAPKSLPRPVVSLTLALNYCLGGLAVGGYHVFNLAVHLLAALTLFGLVRRTLRLDGLRERFNAAAGWLALAVALLWLVHPLQTESVTYIVQRAESLAGLFYLLTLYCVMRGAEAQPFETRPASHRRWYALAIIACALGMASKPTMATAPLVVFAYDRIFLAKDAATAWRKRSWLYAGLAATWLILAALIYISLPLTSAGFGLAARTPGAYAQTQCGVILYYLGLSFWPAALCLDYMWPAAQGLAEILPGALVVGALFGATLWAWVRRPAWSFPGIWFFIILAPTSSFMPIADLAAEHRLYLPLAALAALVVVSVYLLGAAFLRSLTESSARRRSLGKLAATVSIVTAAALLGSLTYQRNADYHDPLLMWQDVINKRPDNWRAYNGTGFELHKQGRYEDALSFFDKALDLNPRAADAYNNRGATREKKGDYDGAIADFNMVLGFNQRYAEAYYNRGNARQEKGDYGDALADYTKALSFTPRYAGIYNNRGNTRLKMGDCDGALADYAEALACNPRYAYAYSSCGMAREKKGDYAGAFADFDKALDLDRSNWQAWIGKGLLLVKTGKDAEAQPCFEEGLKINPGLLHSLADMLDKVRAERQTPSGKAPAGK